MLHSVRGKGGVWQGDGAQAGPAVIPGAVEIGKRLSIKIRWTSVSGGAMGFLATGVTEIGL